MIGTPVGGFRFEDASSIVISAAGDRWCWRRLDGTFGVFGADGVSFLGDTDRPDGHTVGFRDDTLSFDGRIARRIPLDVTDTGFNGAAGTRLAGRLIMPAGTEPVPVVVLVHGAEFSSAVEGDWMQWLLPAEGVGAFVYDKRGTGSSEGSYTQDFELLADDVAAAVTNARRLGGTRIQRLGIRGASQGGWVGPMAALRSEIDFVLVVFGLAVSPLDEDREAAVAQLITAGHGPEAVRKATEITDAVARVLHRETDGFDELDALCTRYQDENWYADLRGNIFQAFKHLNGAERDALLAEVLTWRTPLDHDPREILRAVDVPQLWALGSDDLDAPPGETLRRLAALRAEGRDITTVVFDGAEHGMTMFETDSDGHRIATSYPAGYFQMILDFAAGTLDPHRGSGTRTGCAV
jgi:pimeloyl-ACP methyl ester carboxylesterase